MSFRVENKETHRMTGVNNTETLKTGEFILKRVGKGLDTEHLKSFFVDRIEDWEVFNNLNEKIGEDKHNVKKNNIVNFKKDNK
jgi:spore coat polysaccharide biosynthesis protein SpsF (cytidylyltransferase family)